MADNNSNNNQNYFGGLNQEQIGRIILEELSRSGFPLNGNFNFNSFMPSVINRIIGSNGGGAGNYLMQMLMKGFMGNMNRK